MRWGMRAGGVCEVGDEGGRSVWGMRVEGVCEVGD